MNPFFCDPFWQRFSPHNRILSRFQNLEVIPNANVFIRVHGSWSYLLLPQFPCIQVADTFVSLTLQKYRGSEKVYNLLFPMGMKKQKVFVS